MKDLMKYGEQKKKNLAQLVQSFHLFRNLKKKDSNQKEKLYHY